MPKIKTLIQAWDPPEPSPAKTAVNMKQIDLYRPLKGLINKCKSGNLPFDNLYI